MTEYGCGCEDLKARIRHLELLLRDSEADAENEYYRGVAEGRKEIKKVVDIV
jgi:hypothetical protein